MKICVACGEAKTDDQYGVRRCHSTGRNPRCKACVGAANRKAHQKYRAQRRLAQKQYYESTNRYQLRKEHYETNRKAWRERNRDREAKACAAWKKTNPEKQSAYAAARRAAETRASMPCSSEALHAVYQRARHLSQLTGVPHHVDHVVPLRGKRVCGLHVPWNLQCIPKADNLAKSNLSHGYAYSCADPVASAP